MKNDTFVILGAAAAALYVITKSTRPRVPTGSAMQLNGGGQVNVPSYTKQIFNTATAGQEGYGWQYFSDGTAIGPDGSYYQNGQKVWSPT